MSERVYGKKYDEKLSSKDVAAKVRDDIKSAIKKGDLPKGLKVSVRYDHFSGGSSVRASITAWPEGFLWLNPAWVIANKENPDQYNDRTPRYTKKASEILGKIESMREAYNHDGSDSQTDYYDVKYYGSTDVGWELEQPEADRVFKEWTSSATTTSLKDIVLGDEVMFVRGELKGLHFTVTDIGNGGPKNIHGGLCLGLKELGGNNELYADGYDLNGLVVDKPMPLGIKVLRFKHK